MTNERILTIVVTVLGAAFLACIALVGYLAAQPETRPIPDVLVGAVTGILGLFGGLLIPTPARRNDRGAIDTGTAVVIAVLVLLVLVVLGVFR